MDAVNLPAPGRLFGVWELVVVAAGERFERDQAGVAVSSSGVEAWVATSAELAWRVTRPHPTPGL